MRKLLLVFLGITSLTHCAFSAGGEFEDFHYDHKGSYIVIDHYIGSGGDVIVPETIEGLPVTTIRNNAFYNEYNISSVTLPSSIITIEPAAFRNCYGLTNIVLGTNVEVIADDAFSYCTALSHISLPDSLDTLGDAAFRNCDSLADITIPSNVTTIDDLTFYYCDSLTTVTIENGSTSIGNHAFRFCYSLQQVVIPESVTDIGAYAFSSCNNLSNLYFRGDAPSIGHAFQNTTNTTVFYLPGKTGWGSTFDGRPTALWLPQLDIPRLDTDPFGFNIRWASGQDIIVESNSSLTNSAWQPILTNTLVEDSYYYSDEQWTNYPVHFYRVSIP